MRDVRAPEGQHDDKADAFALACTARLQLTLAVADDHYEPVASPGQRFDGMYGWGEANNCWDDEPPPGGFAGGW
jgi:hypothetical protein